MSKKLIFFIKVLITFLAFYFIIQKIDTGSFFSLFGKVRFVDYLFCYSLFLAGRFLLAFNSMALFRTIGVHYPYLRLITINFTSFFYSFIGELFGTALRWKRLAGTGNKFSEAFILQILERFFQVLTQMAFAATGFFVSGVSTFDSSQKHLIILLFTVFGVTAAGLTSGLYSGVINRSIQRFSSRFLANDRVPGAIRKIIIFADRFFAYLYENRYILVTFFFLYIGYLFLSSLTGLYLFRMFGIRLSFFAIIWVLSASGLASQIPLTVFGLGIREGTLIYLLGKYTIHPEYGLLIGLTYFSFTVLEGIIGGVIELSNAASKITRKPRAP